MQVGRDIFWWDRRRGKEVSHNLSRIPLVMIEEPLNHKTDTSKLLTGSSTGVDHGEQSDSEQKNGYLSVRQPPLYRW